MAPTGTNWDWGFLQVASATLSAPWPSREENFLWEEGLMGLLARPIINGASPVGMGSTGMVWLEASVPMEEIITPLSLGWPRRETTCSHAALLIRREVSPVMEWPDGMERIGSHSVAVSELTTSTR